MKFVVRFTRTNGGVFLKGLKLLDMVRTIITNAAVEEVPSSVYVSEGTEFELTEQEARDSGWFEARTEAQIKVRTDNAAWLELVHVERVTTENGYIKPTFSWNRALLDAWVMSDYPEEFGYPYQWKEGAQEEEV